MWLGRGAHPVFKASAGETHKGEPQTGRTQKAKLQRGAPKVKLRKGKQCGWVGGPILFSKQAQGKHTSKGRTQKAKLQSGAPEVKLRKGKVETKQAQAPKQHYRHPPKPNDTPQPTKHHPSTNMCRCRVKPEQPPTCSRELSTPTNPSPTGRSKLPHNPTHPDAGQLCAKWTDKPTRLESPFESGSCAENPSKLGSRNHTGERKPDARRRTHQTSTQYNSHSHNKDRPSLTQPNQSHPPTSANQ